MPRVLALLLVITSVAAAQAREAPPPKALLEARKQAMEELQKLKVSMGQQGFGGEVADCESILTKLLAPAKIMSEKGGGTAWPGDEKVKALMQAWCDAGDRLSAIYKTAAADLEGAPKDEAELFAGWFDSWKSVAAGVTHLNARRKFCKLSPVMADWSGSYGGYLHGRYLEKNKGNPSTSGLGAHNEDPKLPGYTIEGASAAGGILGGGPPEHVMDSWLGSEYHRDPVFSRGCSRVAFGGLPGGWWSCKNGGGGSGHALADVITFPGDGDTNISPVFGGEGPNPLDKYKMTSSGTLIVIDFIKGKLKKPVYRLLDPDGKPVETLELGRMPMSFVAKEPLLEQSKYTVEVVGQDGAKFSFSFTTGEKFGKMRKVIPGENGGPAKPPDVDSGDK